MLVSESAGGHRESTTQARSGLTRRDFFDAVVERLRQELPEERRDFRTRANSFLLKIDYGNDRVHYEIWCDGDRRILGVALHFEDGPISTAAYLAYFDRLIVEIKHELGAQLELERWTATWAHIYEHWPLETLTDALAGRVARRLSAMILYLQPLVELSGVPPERSSLGQVSAESSANKSGRWSRKRH